MRAAEKLKQMVAAEAAISRVILSQREKTDTTITLRKCSALFGSVGADKGCSWGNAFVAGAPGLGAAFSSASIASMVAKISGFGGDSRSQDRQSSQCLGWRVAPGSALIQSLAAPGTVLVGVLAAQGRARGQGAEKRSDARATEGKMANFESRYSAMRRIFASDLSAVNRSDSTAQ